ncbi:hypothetical protein LPJ56_005838 [Coemansia sp. RSA 2599]|nr:hypothetical protein LPJ75_005835 [Coemansia sp. RSA 2598]KAJ1811116.1 hypothetical protein LPJ56_005838 [Coemansia sp. RSA 2599]
MSTFVLRYFDFPARAEIIKALLTYVDADWKLESPVWPDEKAKQPTGQLPVLVENKPDGTKFVLTDAAAIEQYLLKKYNIFAKVSVEQEARQMQLRNQILDICQYVWLYQFGGSEEVRQFAKGAFTGMAKMIVMYHEEILQKNGSNGHYVGDKIGYADVAMYAGLNALKTAKEFKDEVSDLFSEKNAPLINKVLRAVEDEPEMAEYVATCQ